METEKVLQELEAEFDNLMQSGLDELVAEDSELAEENFSLAATVLDRVKELSLPMAVALENRYLVNPYDLIPQEEYEKLQDKRQV